MNNFEELFSSLSGKVADAYPKFSGNLKVVGINYLDTNEGYEIGFDCITNNLCVSEDFEKRLREGYYERIKLSHIGVHELVHVISYREIEKYILDGESAIRSGLQYVARDSSGKITKVRESLNESITNYFTHIVLCKMFDRTILQPYLKVRECDIIFVHGLSKIVGRDVLEKAYFLGDFPLLVSKLKAKGIDAKQFLANEEDSSPESNKRSLNMIFKKVKERSCGVNSFINQYM